MRDATSPTGGRTPPTREIEAAARAVGALEMVARAAGRLSAPGRRARAGICRPGSASSLALARAELVDPDMLLLDEATAALDLATEAAVLAAAPTG